MFGVCRCLFVGMIMLITIPFVLITAAEGICKTAIRLDEEAVFCLYFRMSGEPINDQDIEDLCYTKGKPLFSSYKPAELIFKKTLTEEKERLLRFMKTMDEKSEFEWRFDWQVDPGKRGFSRLDMSSLESEFPIATPFIRAAVSKRGKKALTRAFGELRRRRTHSNVRGRLELDVRFVAERVERAYQRRNIAMEDVLLPIRSVFFRSVRIEMRTPKGSAAERLVCNIAEH